MPTLTPNDRLAAIRLRDQGLARNIVERITGTPSLELSSSEVSQFTFGLEDPDFRLLRSGLLALKTKVSYLDLDFEIAALETGGQVLTETLAVTCRPRVAQRLRRLKGPLIRNNLSPTEFAKLIVERCGGELLGEPSAKRKQVGLTKGGDGQRAEDGWDGLARLASELGYWLFEARGRVYFGRPSWLIKRGRDLTVRYPVGRRDELTPDTVPVCRRSIDAEDPVTVDVDVPYDGLSSFARPGQVLELLGVPKFGLDLIVTSVGITLDNDNAPVTISASSPVDPEPQPPETSGPGDGEGSGSAGSVTTGGASSQGLVWPVRGPITSGYGPRGSGFHYGVDIGVPDGTRCGAAKAGTVTVVSYDSDGYGNWVEIDHGGGIRTRYGHLSKAAVSTGSRVERGQVIGWTDSTGNATGPHLHFEVRVNGSPVDPMGYLP